MRLKEIAENIARLDGVEVEETHARLRNPLMKQLLESEPGRSRNSPANFSEAELYRARLLLACADCGLTTADLEKVNAKLNDIPIHGGQAPGSAKGVGYGTGLACIIRGAEAGEEWFVCVKFKRLSNGRRDVVPHVRYVEWDDFENGGTEALDDLNGRQHLGTLNVAASDLIAPLFNRA